MSRTKVVVDWNQVLYLYRAYVVLVGAFSFLLRDLDAGLGFVSSISLWMIFYKMYHNHGHFLDVDYKYE